MYSQCPECNARFRVGADDLRAAGGTVRCGRCGSAFNALAWLSDTLPPSLGDAASVPAPGARGDFAERPGPVSGVGFHFTADDIEGVFVEPDTFKADPPIVVESENQSFEDITLEGEQISVESILGFETKEVGPISAIDTSRDNSPTDEFELLRDVPGSAYPEVDDTWPDPDAEPVPAAAEETVAAARAGTRPMPASRWGAPETGPAIGRVDALAGDASLAAALEARPVRVRPTRSSLAWLVGGLLLALVLLAQLTHQFRQDLLRRPQLGPLLRDAYAWIGLPVSANWDLGAFELRQWGSGGGPDASGRLTVRASLTNRASFAQPHPILRLELDDRFGDSIAVRDFEPAEYLKNAAEAARLLAPGASAEAELVVVNPGHDAVGYQVDVCLRESAEILRCAQGAG